MILLGRTDMGTEKTRFPVHLQNKHDGDASECDDINLIGPKNDSGFLQSVRLVIVLINSVILLQWFMLSTGSHSLPSHIL